MTVITQSRPFGSDTRTRALIALSLLEESYARELARLLGSPLSGVQAALQGLERDGLVGARSAGRTRLYRLEPRYFAAKELKAYLDRLGRADKNLEQLTNTLRKRPRRTGKPL